MKVTSQKTVYSGKYFDVEEVEIEKNNQTFTKSFINRKPFVMILPMTETNEIYLVSQYRETQNKICLEAVAGFIEDGEEPETAAKRELKEEVGVVAKKWRKLATWNLSANMHARAHLFLAQDLKQGEQQLDPEEDIKIIKIPLHEAVNKIVNGEIDIAPSLAAILLLDNLQKSGKIE
jgi:ADP-ribose pyrophosphatase